MLKYILYLSFHCSSFDGIKVSLFIVLLKVPFLLIDRSRSTDTNISNNRRLQRLD